MCVGSWHFSLVTLGLPLLLTSLPLARAKPPPRRSTMPHGNFFWATFQVSRGGVGPTFWRGTTDSVNSVSVLNICTVPLLKICNLIYILSEWWLTYVKILASPWTETWGFRGENKKKYSNEDSHGGICHIPERWKKQNEPSYNNVL